MLDAGQTGFLTRAVSGIGLPRNGQVTGEYVGLPVPKHYPLPMCSANHIGSPSTPVVYELGQPIMAVSPWLDNTFI